MLLHTYPINARRKNWTSKENVRGGLSFLLKPDKRKTVLVVTQRQGETKKTFLVLGGRNRRKTLTFLRNKQRVLTKARQWCFCIQDRRFCWHQYWVQASRQYEIRHSRVAEQAMQEQVWFSQVQQLLLAPYLWYVFYFFLQDSWC